MRKIWNKGHRIRASDKHLVYHFSIGTLLFVFVAVLLLLNIKQLMRTDWEHFSLLENGLTLSTYNFITIGIATGVCAFLNREGLPKVAGNYEGMVRGLIKKYNKYHTDKLPNITPHSFRHTYCTNMANRGMNPNTLQYLMGHANITMTLGYYAHGTFQSAKAELERLAC